MGSINETVLILAVVILISGPWLLAFVLAVKDISRNPGWFTYLLAVAVALGSTPVAIVYLAYRAWRGVEPTAPRPAS